MMDKNPKLIKKPGLLVESANVPDKATISKMNAMMRFTLSPLVGSKTRWDMANMKSQLYKIIIPAAVVTYSYTLDGNNLDATMDIMRTSAVNATAGSGTFNFHFICLLKRAGASPSSERVSKIVVTEKREADIVEKPAMIIAPINT